jgi:hypothetical protein
MLPVQIAGSGWQALARPDDLARHNSKWLACVASGANKPDRNAKTCHIGTTRIFSQK